MATQRSPFRLASDVPSSILVPINEFVMQIVVHRFWVYLKRLSMALTQALTIS